MLNTFRTTVQMQYAVVLQRLFATKIYNNTETVQIKVKYMDQEVKFDRLQWIHCLFVFFLARQS